MTKKTKTHISRALTKKQRARAEREALMNRWLIIGAAALGLLIVGLLLYGYLSEVALAGREPVAVVNGVPIRTDDFQARVRQRRMTMWMEQGFYQEQLSLIDPNDPAMAPMAEQINQAILNIETQLAPEGASIIGGQVLDDMVQEILIRQEAERLGITVSREEVDRLIESQFGYDRDAAPPDESPTTPGESPTATQPISPTTIPREEYEQRLQNYIDNVLKPSGMGLQDLREQAEASLLTDLVREVIVADIQSVVDQVDIRYASFSTQEEAQQFVARLDGGETWDDIATEIGGQEGNTAVFGGPSWLPQSMLTEQFGELVSSVVFETPVDSYTQPVLGSGDRYYVILVSGHEEREMPSYLLTYEQSRVFEDWLAQQKENVEYNPNWLDKVPLDP